MRRSRRTRRADPTGQELRGQLLDERATDLAADLLAAIGDRERRLEDRLRADPLTAGAAGRRPEQGREHRPPPVGVGRLAVHHRPRQQSLSGASRRRAASRSGRPVGRPGSRRRRRPARPGRRPGTSWSLAKRDEDDLREGGQPVDGPMRVDDPARSHRWRRRPRATPRLRSAASPRAATSASSRSRHAAGQVVDVRPLVLDLLAEFGERDVRVEGAVDGSLDGLAGHGASLRRRGDRRGRQVARMLRRRKVRPMNSRRTGTSPFRRRSASRRRRARSSHDRE